MFELYKTIWQATGRRQIVLILLSLGIAGIAAVPLEYQKNIVNGLTDSSLSGSELMTLCAGMGGVILLSLAMKWLLGYRSSILGEDIIRRIRQRINRVAVDDTKASRSLEGGTLSTMVSAEAEEVGKFTGSAISEPLLQAGTLVAVIGYIASTQPVLGMIAVCMILPQVAIVLSVQKQVNKLIAERVRALRHATDQIVSSKDALEEISSEFDHIYETRTRMFLWKQSSKFFLSAINGAGTVSVLLLGGWQVLEGNTDVGTIVAATAGLARIQGPTNFLIAFYRQLSATRVKFDLLKDSGVRRDRSVSS